MISKASRRTPARAGRHLPEWLFRDYAFVVLEREDVAAATSRLLGDVAAGGGRALFILGEAGMGKTACLQAGCAAATATQIGLGQADPMESMLPFGLVAQAIESLGGKGILRVTGSRLSPVDVRAGRFFAVLGWLEERAAAPVLLGLDDLHWADPDSLALLSFLVRRIQSLPVAIIGTLRPWPSAAQELVNGLVHDGFAQLAQLEPLSERAAGILLTDLVGRRLPEGMVSEAWQACAGNPLLLEQVAAVLERGEEVGELGERGGRQLAQELLLARFAGLPPAGLRIARAAGIFGGRFRGELAARVAGVRGDDIDVALDALSRSGLTRPAAGGGLEFTHPLFRQALYEDTSPAVRTRLHAKAFSVLYSRGSHVEAAGHARRGELVGDPDAIAVLSSSGRAALATGALEVAVDHLSGAVELAGETADSELVLAWGEALLAIGRAGEAVRAGERVLSRADMAVPLRLRALRMTGRAHTLAGAHERASACYGQAVEIAAVSHPDLAAEALIDHALTSWLVAGPSRALPLAERARELARGGGPTLRARAAVAWGFTALQSGDARGLDAVAQAARPLLADPMSDVADLSMVPAGTLASFAMCTSMVERLEESERAATLVLTAAERVGAVATVASISVSHAYTLYRMGRLADALDLLDRGAALLEFLPMAEPYITVGRAHVLLHLGRVDESEACRRRAEELARQRGEWNALLFVCDVRGQRLLGDGDPGGASDVYLEAEQISIRTGIDEPCWVPWGRHAVAAHTGAGRLDDAHRVVGWLARCAGPLPCRWPRIAAATGQAWLAEQAGRRDDAAAHFDAALHLQRSIDLPLERIETLLAYGAFLRRGGHTAQARALLAEAVRIAEATGAR
ncbi:MAG TPA: AAA family ATPase [Streptosporangiaceae bacterium]